MRVDRNPLALVPGQGVKLRRRGIVTLRLRRGGSSAAVTVVPGKCGAKTRRLLANPVRKIIMWSTQDATSGYEQCPEYYDMLTAHTEDEIAHMNHHSKVWIGTDFEMDHDWFRFLIDGWQDLAPENKNNHLRREAWRFLCGRRVPDAA